MEWVIVIIQIQTVQHRLPEKKKPNYYCCSGRSSATGVDVLFDRANLTGNLATPLETAMTVDTGLGRPRFVTAPTAEQFTALHSRRRAVTYSTSRAQGTRYSVRSTKVWRFFRINQVLSTRWFDAGHFRNDCFAIVPWRIN